MVGAYAGRKQYFNFYVSLKTVHTSAHILLHFVGLAISSQPFSQLVTVIVYNNSTIQMWVNAYIFVQSIMIF